MINTLEKATSFITRKINGRAELLLIKHPYAGIQIPAGTVELEEHHTAAAEREAWEETGIKQFQQVQYIGHIELLHNQYFYIHKSATIYARPDSLSFDWVNIRRGIMVKDLGREEGEFRQVEYTEYDRFPDPQYVSYSIVGWAKKECLAQREVRHFYHLTCEDTRTESWKLYTDQHHFELFWAPLDSLPGIVEKQQEWFDFCVNQLNYSFE